MDYIETILGQLQDSEWHSVGEIRKNVSLPDDELNKLLRIMEDVAFIDKKNEELRIASLGLKLLELPT